MNKETLVKLYESPEQWDALDAGTLQGWMKDVHWFQGLHLLLLKKLHGTSDSGFGTQLNHSSLFVPDRKVLWHLLHNPEPLPEPEIDEPSDSNIQVSTEEKGVELIDRFIQAEPRIKPREGTFDDAVELAEKSNIPVFDLVTETLANVYLQQGNRGKALKILEKLSLSMPEKSSYFAARIAEIKSSPNSL